MRPAVMLFVTDFQARLQGPAAGKATLQGTKNGDGSRGVCHLRHPGFMLLIGLMIYVTIKDIVRFV